MFGLLRLKDRGGRIVTFSRGIAVGVAFVDRRGMLRFSFFCVSIFDRFAVNVECDLRTIVCEHNIQRAVYSWRY